MIVYKDQLCHESSIVGKVALAVTWNAYKETLNYNAQTGKSETSREEFPTQLQLCAWFIDCGS
jgi:hypothetical protein